VLRSLPIPSHPDLLVGSTSGDDAAVWRLSDERALVVTVDVITPVVDDARTWGRVVATNAVSDVYAMGGEPLLALSLVGWNTDELPLEQLTEALAGVHDVAAACAFVVAGGHSITAPEPKLGLAVVGTAHPDRLLTNAGLRPDDVLILT
jgi:selenide,water dikinase